MMIAVNKQTIQARGYVLRIELMNIRPEIWRVFTVPATIKLSKLHHVIQRVMGWYDCHLHEFTIQGKTYGIPDLDFHDTSVEPESKYKLGDFGLAKGDEFTYAYDFGDDWIHQIMVADIIPRDRKGKLYRILEGKRATPPEDCGGPYGYEDFLEAISDKDHEEHESMLEWVGGTFDPEAYPIDDFNEILGQEFG